MRIALFSGFPKPFHSLNIVYLEAACPLSIELSNHKLCAGKPPIRCLSVPLHSFYIIPIHAFATKISQSKKILRFSMPLVSSFTNPFYPLNLIFWNICMRIPVIPATDSGGSRPPVPEQGGRV